MVNLSLMDDIIMFRIFICLVGEDLDQAGDISSILFLYDYNSQE